MPLAVRPLHRPACPSHRAGAKAAASSDASCPHGRSQVLADWLESQRNVMTLWLDRLIEEGDPDDLVSMIHRQAAWLDVMRQRSGEA